MKEYKYDLTVTTQGPIYPPSEIMDENGDFVVIGQVPVNDNELIWDKKIVSKNTKTPEKGSIAKYDIVKKIDDISDEELKKTILYTLPLPLPCNNYEMLFAPEQRPEANEDIRDSLPLHEGYIHDYRKIDGKRNIKPISLYDWMQAQGEIKVIVNDNSLVKFVIKCEKLVPNSLYTIMSLREHDFDIKDPTRPGPLGVPNIMMTDEEGRGTYWAELDNPFPLKKEGSNRIINIIILFMSCRQSYGGSIGLYGLGGDIHAHLKLKYGELDRVQTSKSR